MAGHSHRNGDHASFALWIHWSLLQSHVSAVALSLLHVPFVNRVLRIHYLCVRRHVEGPGPYCAWNGLRGVQSQRVLVLAAEQSPRLPVLDQDPFLRHRRWRLQKASGKDYV
eukprot:TRINITY_DN20006_c0_g1_i1.p2 TRINITY_DN20006_c0_g1~~TRINITY_DN20006_c0_g1_i1.p2  ORF type:complete len:112 (-),score=1.21 TRINITY_DN20006_c0_g1_i1:977-1312(-)